jgi:hypothetical protein
MMSKVKDSFFVFTLASPFINSNNPIGHCERAGEALHRTATETIFRQ